MRFFRSFLEPKNLLLLSALFCAGLLLFAFVLVRVADLIPCPLCIVQRFFYAFAGLSAILGYMAWWPRFSTRMAGLAVAFFSCFGFLIAARQVYLQRFQGVDPSVGCAVSFGSLLDDFLAALGGTGNCAIIDWSFLGFSIADWSLLAFTGLTAAGIWIFLKTKFAVSTLVPKETL